MEIKKALREELYSIAEFVDSCWKEAYKDIVSVGYLASLSAAERYEKLRARFDDGSLDFFIMKDGEKAVGVSVLGKSFTEGYPDDGEIPAIYLRSDYIGKGYGHTLFEELVLDVLSGNDRAVRFYFSHGYEKVGESLVKLADKEYPLYVMREKVC